MCIPQIMDGDYLKRMIKAKAEKQTEVNTNAPTLGMKGTN